MNDDVVYHVYLLLCDQTTIYTGIAIDPCARLLQHQTGHPYGAKFTRKFNHLELVYQVKVGSRAVAQKLELKIKKLTKTQKEQVINQQLTLTELFELTGLNL